MQDVDLREIGMIISLASLREQRLREAAAIDRQLSALRGQLSPRARRTIDRLILIDAIDLEPGRDDVFAIETLDN